MSWLKKLKKRSAKVDPDELIKKAEASLKTTTGNQPRVNLMTAYLNERKNNNGFGEDFEITLLSPRRHRHEST